MGAPVVHPHRHVKVTDHSTPRSRGRGPAAGTRRPLRTPSPRGKKKEVYVMAAGAGRITSAPGGRCRVLLEAAGLGDASDGSSQQLGGGRRGGGGCGWGSAASLASS